MPHSLYLHVPFCPHICPYCDFHKMRRQETLVAAYLDKLESDALRLYRDYPGTLDTVYFGGGTPSHLSDAELSRIVRLFERTWGWPANQETTLEADPLTFDKARLQSFGELGFSRLSIGLQSTQGRVLGFLGRQHDARQGLESVDMALSAGFDVTADLITAVSHQDTESDLHALAATGVPHVSVYSLTIEGQTPFARRGVEVNEDKAADDYLLAHDILGQYGLERYEVSSHAKPGHESRHNQVYWHGEHFIGLGPSAASFLPREGLLGERRTEAPIRAWLEGAPPELMPIDARAYTEDLLLTGLRTRRGVDTAELSARTGSEVKEVYAPELNRLLENGLLEFSGDVLRATATGLMRLDSVLAYLLARPSKPL